MDSLHQKFQPIFDRIAAGAAEREQTRTLPFEQIGWLRDSGFTALRVPAEYGGSGIRLPEFYELLIRLSAADPNLPQALRSHISLIEFHLAEPQGELTEWYLAEAGRGKIFGNGVTEPGAGFSGGFRTRITDGEGGAVLNGEKFYSTGTLYADYIAVAAGYRDEACVYAVVAADHPGVERLDDWNGFGQRLTASGTTRFKDVPVISRNFLRFGGASETFMTAQFQLILLSCLAGIAEAAVLDASEYVRGRKRSFSHGLADLPRDDAMVQQVVGRVSSLAFAAKHTVLAAVASLEHALATMAQHDEQTTYRALTKAELDAQQAQIVVADLVLEATTRMFEVGGASAVDRGLNLDRHWRNARTVSAHNPTIYKERSVGDFRINGTTPVYEWSVGVAAARAVAVPQ
ncbi:MULTISPECIES: acyl-CoA dehydrogenase family protein [unclassified Arthrobacter]|uniref:acyl-CoA dehydrogenase family protein n=1 Tax=unclassified Arthrobacter TaxID=235627 RepID=UPI003392F942